MNNPYRAPAASLDAQTGPAARSSELLFVVGLVCGLLAAIIASAVVPSFSSVFKSFGAELPWLTSWVVSSYWLAWIIPVAVLLTRLFWPRVPTRPLAACLVGTLSLVVLVPLMFVALYWPMFALGAVV
jgi:hypothetical protein